MNSSSPEQKSLTTDSSSLNTIPEWKKKKRLEIRRWPEDPESGINLNFEQEFAKALENIHQTLDNLKSKLPELESTTNEIGDLKEDIGAKFNEIRLSARLDNQLALKGENMEVTQRIYSFIKFRGVLEVLDHIEKLPSDIRDLFFERYCYYFYWINLDKEFKKRVGPRYFQVVEEENFWQKPFVDLWGNPRQLDWLRSSYIAPDWDLPPIAGSTLGSMLKGLDLLYKTRLHHALIKNSQLKIIPDNDNRCEKTSFGRAVISFNKLPGVVLEAVICSKNEKQTYNTFNHREWEKFWEIATTSNDKDIYVIDLRLYDLSS